MRLLNWLFFTVIFKLSYGQFEIPPLKLEAFTPVGIRVSLEAQTGIQLFAFHGKLNEPLAQLEPGDFTEDIVTPTNGYFIYENANIEVKPGDTIYYWIFVQHNYFGYRKDNQQWNITELVRKEPIKSCQKSITLVSGKKSVCSNDMIFEDKFNGNSLDESKWLWEQYFPTFPDFEFNVYMKDASVTHVENGKLSIKPKLRTNLDDEWLDLSQGCTRAESRKSKCRNKKFLIQNPIASGRIVTKTSFTYADVEINAKIPSGDWMYPQIYLEDENSKKLIIAYSRGNRNLQGANNLDLGGSLLFGGLMIDENEPKRSKLLGSYKHSQQLSSNFHTYRLKWTPNELQLFFDGNLYGLFNKTTLESAGFAANSPKVSLVIGVGVGGITDFPDDFTSDYPKPWKNRTPKQVLNFYEARDKWIPSWNSGGLLQIDYVKIQAI